MLSKVQTGGGRKNHSSRSAGAAHVRRMLSLAAAAGAAVNIFSAAAWAANTADNVTNGQTDLTAAGTYSAGSPTTTSDVTLQSGITYNPTAFTLNTNSFNSSIGTLNDLDATQTLTIQNTTGGSTSTITLNGGNNAVAANSAGFFSDLLDVASGGTLSIGTAGSGTLNLALSTTGNLDIAGAANIGSAISGSNGLTKIGVGTLTLSGSNGYTGTTSVSQGVLAVTGSLASTSLALGGGAFTYSQTGTNTQSFVTGGTAINNGFSVVNSTVSTDTLNLGALTRSNSGMVNFGTITGNTATATSNDATGIIGIWASAGTTTTLGYAVANGASKITTFAGTAATAGNLSNVTAAGTNYDYAGAGGNIVQTGVVTANTLRFTGNTITTWANGGFGVSLNGMMLGGSTNITESGAGNITIGTGSNTEFDIVTNAQTLTVNSKIVNNSAGASSVVIGSPNGGVVILGGANTYTGGTYINSRVQTSNNTALGTGNVALQGGTLALNGSTLANNLIAATGAFSTIDEISGDSVINGNLTGNGTITITNTSANGLSLHVGAAVNWSGFTGTLNFTNGSSSAGNMIANGSLDLSNATVNLINTSNNGGTQFYSSGGGTIKIGALTGSSGFLGQGSNATIFQIGNLNSNTTFGNPSTNVGIIQGPSGTSLVKVGTGSLTLNGLSTFQGTTTVENGMLIAGVSSPVSASGAFGNANSAIVLGDATSISGSLTPSLLTGGAVTIGRAVTVGANSNSTTGVFTLGGGTANSSTFSGVSTLNQGLTVTQVAGGTLNLTGNFTSGTSGTQTLTFNNAGDVSQSTGVIGGGTGTIAVTQSGAGVTTITGTDTYGGATTISAGTLTLSGAGSINSSSGITINGSSATFVHNSSVAGNRTISVTQGTFNGNGTVGNVTVGSLAANTVTNAIGAGSGVLTIPTLTFNGSAALGVFVPGGNTTTAGIATTNLVTAITNSGEVTVNVTPASAWASAVGSNTYNLVSFGAVTGNLSDFTKGTVGLLTSRQTATLGLSSGDLTLTIVSDAPKWTGADNGNWTAGTTGTNHNWKLITAGTATDYISGDNVLFDDTAGGGNTSVTISSANVTPAAVTFNNSSLAYTVSSAGGFGIAGNTPLTKTGNGTVTINTSNSYSGGTTLSAGTLVFGNASALGTGTVTLAGGTLMNGVTGSNPTLANNVSVTGSTILDMAGKNVTLSGNLSNSAALTVTNSQNVSTFGLGGNNSGYAGTVMINNNASDFTSASAGSASAAWAFNSTNAVRIDFSGNGTINFGSISGNGSMQNVKSGTTTIISVGALGTSTTFSGTIQDNGTGLLALTKVGAGSLTLTATAGNGYSGATKISAGTLRANNTSGSATGNSAITVSAGVSGNYSGGTLGGSGSVSGTVTLASSGNATQGGIIAAGADTSTTGTLTTGNETWNAGAVYNWKVAGLGNSTSPRGAGNAGGNSTTWDSVKMSGLTLNALGGSSGNSTNPSFTIKLSDTSTLSPTIAGTYSWVIGNSTTAVTAPAGYTIGTGAFSNLLVAGDPSAGFSGSTAAFALDTSGLTFGNAVTTSASAFTLELVSSGSGDNLVLDYTATPEPGTAMLVLGGTLPMLTARRRRRRAKQISRIS